MDLKNNEITVGEIIANPAAQELIKKEFPELNNPFMITIAKNMKLSEVLKLADGRYGQEKIDKIIADLKAL